jgi:hypothetical protein
MRASLANVLDDDEWQTLATPQMLCSNDMATLVLLRLCEEIVSVEIGLCLIHSAKTYTELSKKFGAPALEPLAGFQLILSISTPAPQPFPVDVRRIAPE